MTIKLINVIQIIKGENDMSKKTKVILTILLIILICIISYVYTVIKSRKNLEKTLDNAYEVWENQEKTENIINYENDISNSI